MTAWCMYGLLMAFVKLFCPCKIGRIVDTGAFRFVYLHMKFITC